MIVKNELVKKCGDKKNINNRDAVGNWDSLTLISVVMMYSTVF